ncbi:MAG: DUF1566 domain-containing protein, partial [Flavobacteriales bacterium]|nr:DUF1566 domain-containing protein [Flavobacteriales bacterium]
IATNTTAIALNTAKTGITPEQASAITANTSKVGLTSGQATVIANTSGTNTGDQDISGSGLSGTVLTIGIENGSSETVNLSSLVDDADNDPANEIELPTTGNAGDMNYWNGSAWVTIPTTPNEAATLQMISGVPTWTGGTPPPAIGDFRDGGVVFWLDGSGGGLVCTVSDRSSSIQWYNGSYTTTGATGTAVGTGQANTTAIIASQGGGTYAASLCDGLSLNGYTDWYLPSKDELNAMYANKAAIDVTAIANSGGGFAISYYWSSTEVDDGNAWEQNFGSGLQFNGGKLFNVSVRAVRAF